MKFAGKMYLGILAFSSLVGVYFFDSIRTEKKELEREKNSVALYFKRDECTKFSLQNGNGTFTFERKDFQAPWQMTSPKNVMADQDEVNTLLALMGNISVQRELPEENQNQLEEYGFQSNSLSFEIILNNKINQKLTFGKNVSSSSNSFPLPSIYARATGRKHLLVVDNSSLSSFIEKKYGDFRTKKILNFNTSEAAKIIVSSNDRLEVVQNDSTWQTTAPIETAADNTFILNYLTGIQNLTANYVLESPKDETLRTRGIDSKHPTASLIFEDSEGKLLQNLSLYITKSGIYINMVDGSLGQVDLDLWPELVPKFKYFRNRSVLLGTQAKCETEFHDIIADDILDNVSQEDLQNFGFQNPFKKISCSTGRTEKFDILIGKHVPLNEKNVYLKRSDSNIVYIVNTESLSRLAQL